MELRPQAVPGSLHTITVCSNAFAARGDEAHAPRSITTFRGCKGRRWTHHILHLLKDNGARDEEQQNQHDRGGLLDVLQHRALVLHPVVTTLHVPLAMLVTLLVPMFIPMFIPIFITLLVPVATLLRRRVAVSMSFPLVVCSATCLVSAAIQNAVIQICCQSTRATFLEAWASVVYRERWLTTSTLWEGRRTQNPADQVPQSSFNQPMYRYAEAGALTQTMSTASV